MDECFDLVGIGLGPSNLSLAALLRKVDKSHHFFEKKDQFDWHPEIMFDDSTMQTSFLKDLVTPVDPTNPCSFLNYLCENNLFYPFMNTSRTHITRREYQNYGQWVSQKLKERIKFSTEIFGVQYKNNFFEVMSDKGIHYCKNISVATGKVPWVPEFTSSHLSPDVFNAKSPHLQSLDLSGKRLLIVGGGQTGVEIFRNALREKWGRPDSLQLISRRGNLEPLDESAFANEFFTPNYVEQFWPLDQSAKDKIVSYQKLTSDGNTPSYLRELYNELYQLKFVHKDSRPIEILPSRNFVGLRKGSTGYIAQLNNTYFDKLEELKADVVILATGFKEKIPPVLEPLFGRLELDSLDRFIFNRAYSLKWDGPQDRKIYALNFSRHNHGITDPQTSLMAWRSATVINDLVGDIQYPVEAQRTSFLNYSVL